MLMFRHRRDADQISPFPVPPCAVVNVIAAPLDDEYLLFGHVPVFARPACWRNFLHIQPDSSRRAAYFRMGEPFQPALPAPFPWLFFVRNHMGHRVTENVFVMKQ